MTPPRRWYWPRTLVKTPRWHIWLAPTFFACGVGIYPAAGESPTSITFGIWPILVDLTPVPAEVQP